MSSKKRGIGVCNMKKMGLNGNKNLIHKQLKLIRVKQGLTQEQLAARMQVLNANMNQQEISRIEKNARIVTDYELACFCKALHCTERELLQDFFDQPD